MERLRGFVRITGSVESVDVMTLRESCERRVRVYVQLAVELESGFVEALESQGNA